MSEQPASKSDLRDVASVSAKSVKSNDGVEGSKKSVSGPGLLPWTTSRWELWSFYLYYIVSAAISKIMDLVLRSDECFSTAV